MHRLYGLINPVDNHNFPINILIALCFDHLVCIEFESKVKLKTCLQTVLFKCPNASYLFHCNKFKIAKCDLSVVQSMHPTEYSQRP